MFGRVTAYGTNAFTTSEASALITGGFFGGSDADANAFAMAAPDVDDGAGGVDRLHDIPPSANIALAPIAFVLF